MILFIYFDRQRTEHLAQFGSQRVSLFIELGKPAFVL